MTLEEFESVLRVNLTGTFNVTQKAGTVLRNGGRVINLSSVSGQMGCSVRLTIPRAKLPLSH